jgi:hypothetical protein
MAANDRFLIVRFHLIIQYKTKLIQIGSGGGDAIAIRDELVEGSTRQSETFQSPELVPGGVFIKNNFYHLHSHG